MQMCIMATQETQEIHSKQTIVRGEDDNPRYFLSLSLLLFSSTLPSGKYESESVSQVRRRQKGEGRATGPEMQPVIAAAVTAVTA